MAALIIVAGLTYLPGQTVVPAVDRTEGVVALSSRHIVETGDVFSPRWGDKLQVFRPVGTFWLQAAALAGQHGARLTEITAYRVGSFLATLLAVGLIFGLGRGLFGPEPAFVAALSVAVTPIVALHAQLAIAEPLVLPILIASQLALYAIWRSGRNDPPPRWFGWLGLFWVMLGAGAWFNALAVALLALTTILGLAVVDRSIAPLLRLKPWFGVPLSVAVALPWLAGLWVIGGGEPFDGLGWRKVLDVLEGGQDMKFKTAHGVFIAFVALAFIPVSHMLGPAVARAWGARRDPAVKFLLVWLIAPVIALEAFSNKPPLYTVQAVFPAGALLVAMAVTGRLGLREPFKAWPGFFTGASLLLATLVPSLSGGLLWLTGTPATIAVAVGAVLIVALFIVAGFAAARGEGHAWLAGAIAATFVLDVWFFGALMPGLRNTWTAPQVAAAVREIKACGVDDVVVTGFREPSLPLALGDDAAVATPEAAGRAAAAQPRAWAIVEERARTEFAAAGGETARADLGCMRSINMARGCRLTFRILAPVSAAAGGAPRCRLSAPASCPETGGDAGWLELEHCR